MSLREGSGLWAEFLKLASLVTPSLQTRLIKSRNPATAGPYSLPPGPGASGSVTRGQLEMGKISLLAPCLSVLFQCTQGKFGGPKGER